MRRVVWLFPWLFFTWAVVAYAQFIPPGFPPGAFLNRGALDAGSAPTYTGPGDVVSGAIGFWGLRAYNAAYATGTHKLANVCTPLDAACADVSSAANGSFNLSGAGSLTCNNTVSICTIKTFYDQSGFNGCNSAASPCDVTQATISQRFTLVVPGAANGCATTSDFCASANSSNNQFYVAATNEGAHSQPFTFAYVAEQADDGQDETLLGDSSTNVNGGFKTTGIVYMYAGGVAQVSEAASTFYAIGQVFNSPSCVIYVNAASAVTADCGSTTLSSSAAPILGYSNFSTQYFSGIFQEAGIWPSGFSSGQASSMSANQRAYWGF